MRAPNAGPVDAVGHEHLPGREPGLGDRPRAGRPGARRARVAGGAGARRRRGHRADPPPPRSRRGGAARCASAPARRWQPAPQPGRAAFEEPSLTGLRARRRARATATVSGRFEVIATPGHAADHVSLLAGERAVLRRHRARARAACSSRPAAARSPRYLDRCAGCRRWTLEALCPGHGPVVWDPRAKLREYLEHRLDRERRLVAALERGLRTTRRAARRGLGRRARGAAPGGGAHARGAPREARAGGPPAGGRRAPLESWPSRRGGRAGVTGTSGAVERLADRLGDLLLDAVGRARGSRSGTASAGCRRAARPAARTAPSHPNSS